MTVTTFVETLSSSLDIGSIDKYFVGDRKKSEAILKKLRPEGSVDGNRFKLASVEGGQGKSFDYNFQNHQWGDWGKANAIGGNGIVAFICATQRCSAAQAVKFLVDEKFLDQKQAKKSLQDAEGDPLVFPIPGEAQPWDYVRECQILKKDRGIIKYRWEYRDTDGTLLGWKYRVDDRRTSKEVYTLTYRAESGWVKKAWEKKIVPAYGLEQLGDGTPTVRVLFVEGEKAKDKATELLGHRWKVLSFSGATASDSLWLPDNDFWEDTEVVIWPDNDPSGRESARKIQLTLERLTHKPREIRLVRVENFPGLPPKWDLADWVEGCPVDPAVEVERAESLDSFEHICRQWIYVSQQDSFYNMEDRSLVWTATSFDRTYSRFKDKSGSPSQKFLSDVANSQAHDLDFVPGEGPIIVAPNGFRFLNEWYATSTYERASHIANDFSITDEDIAENARFFIEHMSRICGDEIVEPDYEPGTKDIVPGTEERTLVDALTWHFSEMVRRPMDKRGWIPMLVSTENGTGKTYFKRMMASVMGATRAQTITVKELVGDYHDWADGLLFYELGETKSQDSTEVYEELKKRHSYLPFSMEMLKDRTQNTQQLNIKTKAKKRQRDFLNGYITSNDLFPLALASTLGQEGSDRRLLVINCPTILTEKQTVDLFDDELIHRAEWIGAYLMRYQAKFKWNNSWAPITHHKRLMLEKDRIRTENKSDKFELGRYDEFYHLVRWALEEHIGGMARKAYSGEVIRSIAEAQRVRHPYDMEKFESILKKAGIHRGPTIKIDGSPKRIYTHQAEMLEQPTDVWKAELRASINEPGI